MINIKNRNIQTMVNLASSILTMVISMAISFFLSPYIVTNLGEEANGFAQLANSFIMYASLITLALNSMAGRFISISYHKNDLELANKYYSSLIIGNAVIMVVLVLPSVFCIYQLDKIINISTENVRDVKTLFSFVFLTFFVSQITGILSISTYVMNKLYLTNIIGIFRTFLNAMLLILLFSMFNPKIYFVSLVGVILSFMTLIATYYVKKKVLPDIRFDIHNFSIAYIWKMITSGVWNTINQCGNILMTGLDLLLANLFIDPIQMGILSVAKIVPASIINLAGIINTNFSPNLTIIYAEDDQRSLIKQLRSCMKISSVLVSIPIMVFCVYGIEFYQLWMPTLDAKALTTLSLLTCMAFIPFAGPQALYNVYTTTNKLALNSITVLAGGVLNFVIVYIIIKNTSLGVYAIAGVSAIISMIRNLIITVPYTARILKVKWYEFYKDVAISLLCCLLCFIISVVIKTLVVPNGWVMLSISVIISCILCFTCNIVAVLNQQEKLKIITLFRRK